MIIYKNHFQTMKNFKLLIAFSLMAMVLSVTNVSAQYVERKTRDSAGIETKYVTFLNTKKNTTAFQIVAVKDLVVGGTLAGTVTLERRIDTLPTRATSIWKQVGSQSYTISNITGPQGDIFPISLQDGVSYRFKIVGTGGKSYLYASYLHW